MAPFQYSKVRLQKKVNGCADMSLDGVLSEVQMFEASDAIGDGKLPLKNHILWLG